MRTHRPPSVRILSALVPSAIAAALGAPAAASVTRFNDRAAFNTRAAIDGVTINAEGFESYAATNAFDLSSLSTPRATFTFPNSAGVWNQGFQGASAPQGVNYILIQNSPSKFGISFTTPVTHFALTLTDWGDAGSGILSVGGPNFPAMNIVDTSRRDGEKYFFGFVSDTPVTSLLFQCTNTGDSYGFDDVLTGAVPGPGAVPMLAGGLALVVRRRR